MFVGQQKIFQYFKFNDEVFIILPFREVTDCLHEKKTHLVNKIHHHVNLTFKKKIVFSRSSFLHRKNKIQKREATAMDVLAIICTQVIEQPDSHPLLDYRPSQSEMGDEIFPHIYRSVRKVNKRRKNRGCTSNLCYLVSGSICGYGILIFG